jgi:HlyD family secretion protein
MLPARKDLIDAAREKVKTAENSLKAAKWRLEQRTVYAKNNARVFDIYLRKGEYAAPNSPVISLIDRENIKVRFFVRYADAARLKIGDEVEFMTEKSGEKYPAVINYISQKPEYTPPVIYSRENTEKLLFMVEACPVTTEKETLNPGLPVLVKPVKNGK